MGEGRLGAPRGREEGRAREAVAQRLEQESDRLAVLEASLAEAERPLRALEAQRAAEWLGFLEASSASGRCSRRPIEGDCSERWW
jgi:hypothetical protein